MKVGVKDLAVTMDLGSKGIELYVYDLNGTHLGDLRIGKATIEWCKGRTRSGNGQKVKWPELVEWLESRPKG